MIVIWLGQATIRGIGNTVAPLSATGIAGLIGMCALGACGFLIRLYLEQLADSAAQYTDPESDMPSGQALQATVEKEIARSRRFGREFSLILIGLDRRRLRFDHRRDKDWRLAFQTTTELLRSSRANVDRVFRHDERTFALVLPETGPNEVTGLIRRLNRLARAFNPGGSEPEGPSPINFGVTFFPQAATTAEDLIRRAEITLRLAEKSPTRVKYDGAEAPDLPAPELLRRADGGTPGPETPALEQTGPDSGTSPAPPLEDALGALLEHLDATLDLIEEFKSA